MLTLSTLKSPRGAHRNTKRLGRGQASGQGKQAGRGHKGQKARSGGGVRPGFESGHMPMYIKLPQRGFKNAPFKTVYAIVNIGDLDARFDGAEVSRETLTTQGFLSGINKRRPIKILGEGELGKALTFKGIEKFSKTAVTAVTKAKGTIEGQKEK